MASIIANLSPPFLVRGRKSFLGNFQSSPVGLNTGKQNRVGFVVKASGESSESSTSITVVKSVQSLGRFLWNLYRYLLFNPDRQGEKFEPVACTLLLQPSALESSREELFQILSKSISDVPAQ